MRRHFKSPLEHYSKIHMRFETLHPTKNAQLRLERRRKRVVFLNTQEIGNNIYGPWQWQYF